jgi:hypothetical protein
MLAIGRGIGNGAAHETGHRIVPSGPGLMDCDLTCQSPDVFERGSSTGANEAWFYVPNAVYLDGGNAVPVHVHWGPKVQAALERYLLK